MNLLTGLVRVWLCLIILSGWHPILASSLSETVHQAIENSREIALSKTKVQIAQARYDQAVGAFLPTLSMGWSHGKQRRDVHASTLDGNLADYQTKTITLSQPIFNGFQSSHQAQATKYDLKSANYEESAQVNETALSAIEAYLSVLRFQESLRCYDGIMAYSAEILTLMEQQYKLRIISQAQMAQYRSNHWEFHSQYLNIRKQLVAAQSEYHYLVGKLPGDLSLPDLPQTPLDLTHVQKIASENPSVRQYEYLRESARARLAQSKGALLPTIQFIGNYERQENVIYLDNSGLETSTYYVDVSMPIFESGVPYAQIHQATEQYRLSEQEYSMTLEKLENQFRKTLTVYQVTQDALTAYQDLEKETQTQVDEYFEQLKLGMIDRGTVLELMITLNQIKLQHFTTKVELLSHYYQVVSLLDGLKDAFNV